MYSLTKSMHFLIRSQIFKSSKSLNSNAVTFFISYSKCVLTSTPTRYGLHLIFRKGGNNSWQCYQTWDLITRPSFSLKLTLNMSSKDK